MKPNNPRNMKLLNKVLIANRGEIALRIIQTARRLGIVTVAVYSVPDRHAAFVSMADEAWCLGDGGLAGTYLNIPAIIRICKESGCDAIHPGYGFLSENPEFAEACVKEGIIWVGPSPEAIRRMGNKIEARKLAQQAGLPVSEGFTGSTGDLLAMAGKLPYPVLIKAAAGGGGKGMRIVHSEAQLPELLETTQSEALASFGDGTVYVEQFIAGPRHIEVQILGDKHGNVIHLFERECSLQRRYQKIIEEAPSPTLRSETREKMTDAAVNLAKSIGYAGAGTIEFLVDNRQEFYFLEMNTRIQVEHPVTEMITGIDIVEQQFRVAAGLPLLLKQSDVQGNGHSIEARIYAEDPANGFRPSPGDISMLRIPVGDGIRVDSAYSRPARVEPFFDPMIAKLIVYAPTRESALRRLEFALGQFVVHGIHTNIPFLACLSGHEALKANQVSTRFVDDHLEEINEAVMMHRSGVPRHAVVGAFLVFSLQAQPPKEVFNPWDALGYWRLLPALKVEVGEGPIEIKIVRFQNQQLLFAMDGKQFQTEVHSFDGQRIVFSVNGQRFSAFAGANPEGDASITMHCHTFRCSRSDVLPHHDVYSAGDSGAAHTDPWKVTSPMPGRIIRIQAVEGNAVRKGDTLVVVESMKMENSIRATTEGCIRSVLVEAGEMVDTGKIMVVLTPMPHEV